MSKFGVCLGTPDPQTIAVELCGSSRLPLCANDDETSTPRKFTLEDVGNSYRGYAQYTHAFICDDGFRNRGRPEADDGSGTRRRVA